MLRQLPRSAGRVPRPPYIRSKEVALSNRSVFRQLGVLLGVVLALVGASGVGQRLPSAWAVQQWESRAAECFPRTLLGTALAGGRVYAVGGLDGYGSTTVHAYDPAGNYWITNLPQLPAPRIEL